jgi:hypothetical protein
MYFLLNDVVFSLELQLLEPPMKARRVSSLSLHDVERLGRELFAEEPRLQHRMPDRARRLIRLIVSKTPEVNAALFVAPARDCLPGEVAVRMTTLEAALLARMNFEQQHGRLTAAIADDLVWAPQPA